MSNKPIFRRLYRYYQIQDIMRAEITELMLAIVIPVGCILIITSIYSVVRLFHSIGFIISAGVCPIIGTFTAATLKILIEMAARITETTVETQKLAFHPNCANWLRRDDIQFFKSCRPFRWRVGSFFTLEKYSFILIMHSIVITTVINLLLTF